MARRRNPDISEFILRNVTKHPGDIAPLTVAEFGLSRNAINRYINRLIDDGYLEAEGKTRARRYRLRDLVRLEFEITDITRNSSEDAVWRFRILPHIGDVPRNIIDICQYGFTEMFNNVIDHSVSNTAAIAYNQTYSTIELMVVDQGVGIFQKIQADFDLPDPRSALLELSKGKLTSDPERHAGEGIFFASRMFDDFFIDSGGLSYVRHRKDDADWLFEVRDIARTGAGTAVTMAISTDAAWTTKEVFDQYVGDDVRFRKTHVPVSLGNYPGEQLVSRSQAKRILARFD
ncbi:MAG: winged helix-turn-helix domain-containing protein, partial [Rhodospirillales bacterium]|nr:winged helix-turn-helix domain-containing protein [Rhodospirillales bacterium]